MAGIRRRMQICPQSNFGHIEENFKLAAYIQNINILCFRFNIDTY